MYGSPQSNIIAERCNSVFVEHARAMLIDSRLLKFLCKEVVCFSAWIRSHTATRHLDGRTRCRVLYDIKLEIGGVHLWDSWIWVCGLTAGKLDQRGRDTLLDPMPRAGVAVFIGPTLNGWS
jgi:hypothetical protein